MFQPHRGKPRRPRPAWLVPTAAASAVVLLGALGLSMASGPGIPPGERYTEAAARSAVVDALDDFAEHDYVGAWERWPAVDQALMPSAEYARVYELCPPPVAGPFATGDDVAVELHPPAGGSAVITLPGVVVERALSLEGGRWRMHLDERQRSGMAQGAEAVAGGLRALGMCGPPDDDHRLMPKRARRTPAPAPSATRRAVPRPSMTAARPTGSRPAAVVVPPSSAARPSMVKPAQPRPVPVPGPVVRAPAPARPGSGSAGRVGGGATRR